MPARKIQSNMVSDASGSKSVRSSMGVVLNRETPSRGKTCVLILKVVALGRLVPQAAVRCEGEGWQLVGVVGWHTKPYIHINECTCTYMHICIFILIYIYTYSFVYNTYVRVYIYIYMFIYIYYPFSIPVESLLVPSLIRKPITC